MSHAGLVSPWSLNIIDVQVISRVSFVRRLVQSQDSHHFSQWQLYLWEMLCYFSMMSPCSFSCLKWWPILLHFMLNRRNYGRVLNIKKTPIPESFLQLANEISILLFSFRNISWNTDVKVYSQFVHWKISYSPRCLMYHTVASRHWWHLMAKLCFGVKVKILYLLRNKYFKWLPWFCIQRQSC